MLCDLTAISFGLENKTKNLKNKQIHKKFAKQYNTKKCIRNLQLLQYDIVDKASGILSAKNWLSIIIFEGNIDRFVNFMKFDASHLHKL